MVCSHIHSETLLSKMLPLTGKLKKMLTGKCTYTKLKKKQTKKNMVQPTHLNNNELYLKSN